MGRNKLYTAIEFVGLSISLAFVILTSSYLIEKLSYDKDIKDKDKIYVCHSIGKASSYDCLAESFDKQPEIEGYCQFTVYPNLKLQVNGQHLQSDVIEASKNFFEFLPYKLTVGNAEDVLSQSNSAVVSESFAKRMFGGENPVGQIILHEDGNFTIRGVFKDVKRSIIINADIIAGIGFKKRDMGYFPPFANLLRITENADLAQLAESVYKGCDNFMYKLQVADKLCFTKLDSIDKNIGSNEPFRNLKDLKLQNTFIVFCVILLVFSILNYIFLTIAFSRFRLKEMATKMLLGTTRQGIIKNIITESFLFTTVAFVAGILVACALEDSASLVLRSKIEIFGSSGEILWGGIIIILTSILSGIIPALSSSFINPIDTIKGTSRRKDKVILGRTFICIQSCICIVIISITVAMYLQTRKMIGSPLGYKTENLLILSGSDNKEIKNLLSNIASVKSISTISYSPAQSSSGTTEMRFGNERLTIELLNCDSISVKTLGIEFVEIFNNSTNPIKRYITESLYKAAAELYKSQGIDPQEIKAQCAGVVKDFRFGNITSSDNGMNAINILPPDIFTTYLIEPALPDKYAIESISTRLREAGITDFKLETISSQIEESYRNEQNTLILTGTFGLLCILLTIMAIVAISSYYIQIKMHDAAVMKVFGISQKELFLKTVWGFVLPVVVAVPVAIPAAYLHIENWLKNYAVRIDNHLGIYLAVSAFLFVVVFASVLLQAIRLMKTNPADTLKKE